MRSSRGIEISAGVKVVSDLTSTVEGLIQRAKGGSEVALGDLLERYRPFLRLIANRSISAALARRQDASDVVQQTQLEAVRGFTKFRGDTEPEFSAWIKQILRHNVYNVVRDNNADMRKLKREQPLYIADDSASFCWHHPAASDTSPSGNMIRGEAVLELARVLETLPPDQATAVRLRHLEDWALAEIAKHLDRSEVAAAGLVRRGIATLRDRLPSFSKLL